MLRKIRLGARNDISNTGRRKRVVMTKENKNLILVPYKWNKWTKRWTYIFTDPVDYLQSKEGKQANSEKDQT